MFLPREPGRAGRDWPWNLARAVHTHVPGPSWLPGPLGEMVEVEQDSVVIPAQPPGTEAEMCVGSPPACDPNPVNSGAGNSIASIQKGGGTTPVFQALLLSLGTRLRGCAKRPCDPASWATSCRSGGPPGPQQRGGLGNWEDTTLGPQQ